MTDSEPQDKKMKPFPITVTWSDGSNDLYVFASIETRDQFLEERRQHYKKVAYCDISLK